MSILKIPTAKAFEPLLLPARYKGVYGGRGSGKSHFFGELLIETCQAERGTLAVCIREAQRTLAQSSKRLIESKIAALGLRSRFKVYSDKIATPGDGLIIFRGMQDHTAESIKSLEGFRIAWIDEAQSLSAHSLSLLRPTIRADRSELWASWNPYNIPLGGGLPFFGSTAPNSSFAFPYGQPVSRTTYANLFSLLSTSYGIGDGSTTFNLPDLRGRVLAGRDDMGGSAQNRLTSNWFGANATVLGATGGSEKNALISLNQLPQFTPSVSANNLTYGIQGSYYSAGSPVAVSAATGVNNGGLNVVPVGGTISFNSIGASTPSSFTTCQPTIICNFIVRVI